jgi:hypothetical protein
MLLASDGWYVTYNVTIERGYNRNRFVQRLFEENLMTRANGIYRCICGSRLKAENSIFPHVHSARHINNTSVLTRDKIMILLEQCARPRRIFHMDVKRRADMEIKSIARPFKGQGCTDCDICYENKTDFLACGECDNKLCTECARNITSNINDTETLKCPFCRTLNTISTDTQ